MLHEYLIATNCLSHEDIQQINFMLRNPLRADFKLLGNVGNRNLLAFARDLQRQCRQELALDNEAGPEHAIDIVRFDAFAEGTREFRVRRASLETNMQQERQIAVEMIQEDLHREGRDFTSVTDDGLNRLIALYLLTQALVLLECGACTVVIKGRTFLLVKKPAYERALYTTWFCNTMNELSKMADLIEARKVVNEAHRQGRKVLELCRMRPDILDNLTIFNVDKALSLNARFIHKLPAPAHGSLQVVMERARVATLIQLLWSEAILEREEEALNDPPAPHLSAQVLSDLMIPTQIWSEMVALSEKKPNHDKLVFVRGEDRFQLGPLSLAQIMVQYCGEAMERFRSHCGPWFEKEYLLSYIDEEVPKSRYRVYPGGKAKERSAVKFDIDLIIEDVEADRLFFCQVKYRHNPALPFFRSNWYEFFLGNTIQKALGQLKSFAESFDDPAVVDLVRTRTGRKDLSSNYLKEHTSLVIVHNVDDLAFGRFDGVLLYDWNTLRNLLKRQISQVRNDDTETTRRTYSERIPLEDVEATIKHMRKSVLDHPDAHDLESEWNMFRCANMQITWRVPSSKWALSRIWTRERHLVVPLT
jgi:hypothetical protein